MNTTHETETDMNDTHEHETKTYVFDFGKNEKLVKFVKSEGTDFMYMFNNFRISQIIDIDIGEGTIFFWKKGKLVSVCEGRFILCGTRENISKRKIEMLKIFIN